MWFRLWWYIYIKYMLFYFVACPNLFKFYSCTGESEFNSFIIYCTFKQIFALRWLFPPSLHMIDDDCCKCERLFTIEQTVQHCEVCNCVQDTDRESVSESHNIRTHWKTWNNKNWRANTILVMEKEKRIRIKIDNRLCLWWKSRGRNKMWDRLFTAVDCAASACYSWIQHLNFFSLPAIFQVRWLSCQVTQESLRESIKEARGGCMVTR